MFGTDLPFWDPALTFDTVAEAGLSPDAAEAVRAGNARRLYRF
jgi:predicted TIM-barrel fold metal-dependent hydrolase